MAADWEVIDSVRTKTPPAAGRLAATASVMCSGSVTMRSGIAVEAAKVGEVELIMLPSGRHIFLIGVVQAHGHFGAIGAGQRRGEIHGKRQISAEVGGDMPTVKPYIGPLHGPLKFQRDFLSTPSRDGRDVPPVPANSLEIFLGVGGRLQAGGVWQKNGFPTGIVKRPGGFRRGGIQGRRCAVDALKMPLIIQGQIHPAGVGG